MEGSQGVEFATQCQIEILGFISGLLGLGLDRWKLFRRRHSGRCRRGEVTVEPNDYGGSLGFSLELFSTIWLGLNTYIFPDGNQGGSLPTLSVLHLEGSHDHQWTPRDLWNTSHQGSELIGPADHEIWPCHCCHWCQQGSQPQTSFLAGHSRSRSKIHPWRCHVPNCRPGNAAGRELDHHQQQQ